MKRNQFENKIILCKKIQSYGILIDYLLSVLAGYLNY